MHTAEPSSGGLTATRISRLSLEIETRPEASPIDGGPRDDNAPFTLLELHADYLLGKERTIATHSDRARWLSVEPTSAAPEEAGPAALGGKRAQVAEETDAGDGPLTVAIPSICSSLREDYIVTLKIGIVGAGNVARSNYVPFLSRQEDVELTYLSRTREKAEALAAEFGGHVVDTAADLAAETPDAVLVLTRETQRAEAITALLEHKFRRLFFEKPLVAQRGQENVCEEDFFTARDLLRQAEAAGIETAMVFNYRFFEQTQRARRLVAERQFGQPLQVVAYSHYATWSHVIDLIHLFAGPVVAMTAVDSAAARGTGDNAACDVGAAFRLANGAIGTILGTSSPSFAFPLFELTMNFEGGRLHMRDLDGEMEVLDYAGSVHERIAPITNSSRWDHYGASFGKSLDAYLGSIRRAEPPPVSGAAGLEELRFEAALKRAAAQRRWVDLEAEFPLA